MLCTNRAACWNASCIAYVTKPPYVLLVTELCYLNMHTVHSMAQTHERARQRFLSSILGWPQAADCRAEPPELLVSAFALSEPRVCLLSCLSPTRKEEVTQEDSRWC